ncbi:MAG: hypothetical protein JWM21_1377 [Acidobacteria bacterium]|nr:hypothetical protein [Acidobacteriota bacterium]
MLSVYGVVLPVTHSQRMPSPVLHNADGPSDGLAERNLATRHLMEFASRAGSRCEPSKLP